MGLGFLYRLSTDHCGFVGLHSSHHYHEVNNVRILGINITIGLILVAIIFYFLGAKKPGLANKVWPSA